MSPDDPGLAKRVARGERAAFDALVLQCQEPLYRFIRRYVGDADEAYDLLQETLVSAWQARQRYDPGRPVLAWLRRIALNKCRDWGRRRTVRQFFYRARSLETAASAAAEEAENPEADTLARLDAAIARLPMQLKEPLLLTAFEGLSHEAAGAALGVSAKAIETRVYRAKKLLATAINSDR